MQGRQAVKVCQERQVCEGYKGRQAVKVCQERQDSMVRQACRANKGLWVLVQ
jgi:hypothetical protein